MNIKFAGTVVLLLLFFSAAGTGRIEFGGVNNALNEIYESKDISLNFANPVIIDKGKYVNIKINGAEFIAGNEIPSLPMCLKVMTFPFGTKIKGIEVEVGKIIIKQLNKKIQPAPPAIPLNMENVKGKVKEGSIYQSNEAYPSDWMEYNVGAGIKDGKHVIFLSIHAFPCRYIPAKNELLCVDKMKIKVNYEPPEKPLMQNDVYDLVIISPSEFSDALQPLVSHKESHGIKTKLVTLNEIYGGTYFASQGRDDAEKVKYFIKDAIEQWGIKYVLLVGGRHGGVIQEKWWCPVRYSHLDDGSDEKKFLSDLYFSDIYRYDNGSISFEDWDSNGNGIFADWNFKGKDIIDMYPDVYSGRLACRNVYEVNIMVEKITNYENNAYGKQWFKRFVGVAGDTYPDEDDPYYEGELATAEAFKHLNGFEAKFIWTSTGALSSGDDIINAISEGCGFLHFSGHGNPMSWATHPPYDENTWIGIDETQFIKLKNEGMYPVCIVGGCHNNQFNISLLNLLDLKNLKKTYYHSTWGPECWGWWLTRKIDGGAVATIANSGYGYGEPGEECLEKRGRYMEIQFFKSYGEGKDMLGETHATGLTYYLNKFPPMEDKVDTKIVQQWVLLGDPSLKIGGYS